MGDGHDAGSQTEGESGDDWIDPPHIRAQGRRNREEAWRREAAVWRNRLKVQICKSLEKLAKKVGDAPIKASILALIVLTSVATMYAIAQPPLCPIFGLSVAFMSLVAASWIRSTRTEPPGSE